MKNIFNGPSDSITDIDGFLVGNAHDDKLKSGVTVLTRSNSFRASVSILGGAPGTKETDLLLPDKVCVSHYYRQGMYTETGFIGFNMNHAMMEDFIGHYRNLYIDDTVYNLPHYTDCHTFDRTRKIMTQQFTDDYYEKKLGDGGTGHIMARCNLIHDYLDHRKGKRKSQKHSPEWLRR